MTSAQILDGKQTANIIKDELKAKIEQRIEHGKKRPEIAVVLVGENHASQIYVKNKKLACEYVGITSHLYQLDSNIPADELVGVIDTLNSDDNVDGILVQLPLPSHIDDDLIVERIAPEKDVDGFHPYNLGRLAQRRPLLRPCTPHGIMTLIERYEIDPTGKHSVIIGASAIVGRPMALELLQANSTITICHRYTQDLNQYISSADILVVAVGNRNVVDCDAIKPGAVVIDVGIHRLENGKVIGDLDFEKAKLKAGWITPVPGGVGPMTVVTLMQNTLMAAEKKD